MKISSFRYIYVLLNDFFTAGNGVLIKKKLESKDLGKYGVMYYNSLFMLLPAITFAWQTGDIEAVAGKMERLNVHIHLHILTCRVWWLVRRNVYFSIFPFLYIWICSDLLHRLVHGLQLRPYHDHYWLSQEYPHHILGNVHWRRLPIFILEFYWFEY